MKPEDELDEADRRTFELAKQYGVKIRKVTGNFIIVGHPRPRDRQPDASKPDPGCPENPPKTGL